MEADPQADRSGGERCLHVACSAKRAGRRLEGVEERIALSVHLDPAVPCERLANLRAVLGQGLGVGVGAERVEELRRSFDVGEDEGDRSGRQCPHENRIRLRSTFSKGPENGPAASRLHRQPRSFTWSYMRTSQGDHAGGAHLSLPALTAVRPNPGLSRASVPVSREDWPVQDASYFRQMA
ncbi:MAG TPA: hypothetical protein VFW80_12530 [Gaiellaceae bacterium]|nr:hypothetical protein [Gaiellaceae bacterium]